MKAKRVKLAKAINEGGFSLGDLFKEVDRISKKAKGGDKASKQILDSAYQKWEESNGYVLR